MKPYCNKNIVECKDTGERVTGDRYLTTKHWKNMRVKVFNYYGGVCQRCGDSIAIDGAEIHHRIYKRMGNEELTDLVLYCKHCHHCVHKGRKDAHLINKSIPSLLSKLTFSEKVEAFEMLINHFGLKDAEGDESREWRIHKIQHEIKSLKKQLRMMLKEGDEMQNEINENVLSEVFEENIIPPSFDMVNTFCRERKNNISARKFIDYYEKKGWKYKGKPMTNWHTAVYIWENNDKKHNVQNMKGEKMKHFKEVMCTKGGRGFKEGDIYAMGEAWNNALYVLTTDDKGDPVNFAVHCSYGETLIPANGEEYPCFVEIA